MTSIIARPGFIGQIGTVPRNLLPNNPKHIPVRARHPPISGGPGPMKQGKRPTKAKKIHFV